MMENGTKVSSMGTGFGEESQETPILENGATQKLRVTVYILGKMEIGTKESGNSASSMVKEQTFSRTAIPILVSIRTVSRMEKDSTLGKMARSMWESSKVV